MFIKKLQVFNYKSYLDSGLIEFTPDINIIVGQNNSGKTSLLEALTLNFDNQPHRSIKTLPDRSSKINEESKVNVYLSIKKEELQTFLKNIQSPIGILEPVMEFDDEESRINYYSDLRNENPDVEQDIRSKMIFDAFEKIKNIFNNSNYIEINLSLSSGFKIETHTLKKVATFGLYNPVGANVNDEYDFYVIKYDKNGELIIQIDYECRWIDSYMAKIDESIGYKLFKSFVTKIYRFKAERLIIESCSFENNPELKSDMSNLAEVLSILQGVEKQSVSDENWLSKIHGAKILKSMFQELCDNKLDFEKSTHSYELTKWLVDNQPNLLSELAEEIEKVLNKN